jgi:hypothetical protein
MEINGKDLTGIYISIMLYMIIEVEGLNFLRKGGITSVIK